MTAPLVLVVFALLLGVVGPRCLLRASWPQQSPRWGIWAWQIMTLTSALAVVMAGVTLAAPVLPLTAGVAGALRATPFEINEHYSTPAGRSLAAIALVATLVLLTWTLAAFAASLTRSRLRRRRQIRALEVLGTPHPDGFTLLDHHLALVYCLPGRQRTVVVTSAALDRLSTDELHSVLAHERRHLRERHDLAVALSGALAAVFGAMPGFRTALEQVAVLVEMQADDAADSAADRRMMASALLSLAGSPQFSSGPSTPGATAGTRVRRLIGAAHPRVTWRQRAAITTTSVVLLSLPVMLALMPAVEAAARGCCGTA